MTPSCAYGTPIAELSGPPTPSPAPWPLNPTPSERQWMELTSQLVGFPRHLSQHTGGMVMTPGRSANWCPSKTPPCPSAP